MYGSDANPSQPGACFWHYVFERAWFAEYLHEARPACPLRHRLVTLQHDPTAQLRPAAVASTTEVCQSSIYAPACLSMSDPISVRHAVLVCNSIARVIRGHSVGDAASAHSSLAPSAQSRSERVPALARLP